MIEAFDECPKAIRMRHPMANLLFAKQLSMMNEKERLRQTMRELKDYFETESLSESRKKELSGEYFMLLSFLSYKDDLLAEEGLAAAVETVSAGGSRRKFHLRFSVGAPYVLPGAGDG